ncbi:PREDICTED: nucleoporin p58/p45 [Ceratosolen solmsi marchali]|uniref:Nucleoporin p58/p45 n=1 Tax=Ceratosolen solmsi marchali TaxID=326594 RepID=A0AAJ7E0V9_9HYME|nr:PREDICTED: nucleoporin p58/p45 [Ceratosolen solmsi marchali]
MSKFTFGAPITTGATQSFGFPASIQTAPSFSTGTATFGTLVSSSTIAQPSTQIGTSTLNFNFGNTAVTSQTSQPIVLTLGGNTLTSVKSTGLTFGIPTTTESLITTGGSTTGTNLISGGQTNGNLTFGTPITTGLSFGTTTATTGSLNFGTVPTTGTSLLNSSTSGLFGTKLSTTTAATTVAVIVNHGLGGLDVSISNKGLTQGSTSPTTAKENLLPNELMQTIDGFKEFVKTQKVLSSDIARGSARPLNRCSEDTISLMEILTTLAGSVQRDRSLADKLKQDTAKALQNAEIAQRTHDTPTGLQYENNVPLLFFMELSGNFEHDLMLFKSQIEATEKHIQTMLTPKTLTPQELTMAMNKLHESLVAVAGRLQGVHSKVQQQKEQYLNFRKYVLKDNTNVFEDTKSNEKSCRNNIGKITSGPTPFGPENRGFLSTTNLNSTQTSNYGTPNALVWGNVTSTPSHLSVSTMKPPTIGLNFNSPNNLTVPLSSTNGNSNFQLQKPPVGSKRGKH